jgi:E3 ubiquitin-protein ligase UBR1
VINERWVTGNVSTEDKIKTYFIQLLAAGPQLHSDLTKKIEAELCDHPAFDEILMQVADKRLSGGAEQENFVLKDPYYKFFDPYFFHFRRSDREKAEEIIRQKKKKGKSTESFVPPPISPLKASFAALEGLLHSKTLCQMIFYGLWLNFPGFSDTKRPQSDTVLDMSLHLITLALTHSKTSSFSTHAGESFVYNATHLPFQISPTEVISEIRSSRSNNHSTNKKKKC